MKILGFGALAPALALLMTISCSDDEKDGNTIHGSDGSASGGSGNDGSSGNTGGTIFGGGGGDARASGDSGAQCGSLGRTDTCKACLADHCCGEGAKCSRNPACEQNASCLRACEGKAADAGAACMQECANRYFSTAGSDYNPLVLCMAQSCASECPFDAP